MENQPQYCLVLTTYPEKQAAEQFARELVERRYAACVNVLPEMTSVYQWHDKVESGTECQLLIKTEKHRFSQLCRFISDNHPYELPEIVEVPISSGLPAYLSWISESVKS